MTTIILCDGTQERFLSSTPKQLMPIKNTTFLGRIINQCNRRKITPHIITHNPRIVDYCDKQNVNIFYPAQYHKTTQTLLSTQELWQARTTVLLGDVYYTHACIQTVFKSNQDCEFFGNGMEIFAVSFMSSTRITECITTATKHKRGKLWEFYRAYANIPLDIHRLDTRGIYHVIKDKSNDIDTLAEYHKLVSLVDNS